MPKPSCIKLQVLCVQVTGATFSEHSSLLATCGHEGALNLWKSDALEQTILIQVPRKVLSVIARICMLHSLLVCVLQACTCVAFAPSCASSSSSEQDPSPLLCAVGYSDGTARVCSIASGKVVTKLQPHQSSVRTIAYSPDGAHHPHYLFIFLSPSLPMFPIPLSLNPFVSPMCRQLPFPLSYQHVLCRGAVSSRSCDPFL